MKRWNRGVLLELLALVKVENLGCYDIGYGYVIDD